MGNRRYKAGFTLAEVLIAIILVGIAIASLVGANISLTKANGAGVDLATAEFLSEQIKELSDLVAYDDLDDFDGADFSPPIGVDRGVLSNFAAYSQQITVENVSATDFTQVVGDHNSNFVRITVKIFLGSVQISSASWIRARY